MTDVLFRVWVQTLPSALDGKSFSEWDECKGEWRNPACHVRRAGESGTGYKAEFCCIPLTNDQHFYQHTHGELACLMKYCRDPELMCALRNASPTEALRIAAEFFDALKVKYPRRWMTETPEGRAWAAKQQIEVTA